MNPNPLDEYLQAMAFCQWASELAEAVAGVSDDQEQRLIAWKTLTKLMAGRSIPRRVYVAYTFLLQLFQSASRIETIRIAETMQAEFVADAATVFREKLNKARDKAIARIGRD